MNIDISKRWGKKLLLFFCTFLLMAGGIYAYYDMSKKMYAEGSIIDDGPLGETIVDIALGSGGQTYYALTDKGEVYAWGANVSGELGNNTTSNNRLPKRVLNVADRQQEAYYLNNIKKIYAGGYSQSTTSYGAYVFAITNNDELLAWGNNKNFVLGLPYAQDYKLPTSVLFNEKIKDIQLNQTRQNAIILTENKEVYKFYKNGTGDKIKITVDNEGNTLPLIKEIAVNDTNIFLLGENGKIYSSGNAQWAGGLSTVNQTEPLFGKDKDGNVLTNVTRIVTSANRGPVVVELESGDFYVSQNITGNTPTDQDYYYMPLSQHPYFSDPNHIFQNVRELYFNQGGNTFVTNDNRAYRILNYDKSTGGGFKQSSASRTLEVTPYVEGKITADYQNVKKILSDGSGNDYLLSNNGGVFLNGNKIAFGDIVITGTKVKESSEAYKNGEKYHDDVQIQIQIPTGNISNAMYEETDLLTGKKSGTLTAKETYDFVVEDETRIYKQYDFYITGMENETFTSFVIDLYKKTPEAQGITANGVYPINKYFTFTYNGFQENKIKGQLKKEDGTLISYTSSTAITEEGSYELIITDQYGNTNSYPFTITDKPIAESVEFTKSESGELIYNGSITKKDAIIGTLSLKYPEGKKPSTIKAISLGTEHDEANFDIINGNELKIITSDLEAKTYHLYVTGTDQNDMPFSGDFTIVIDKATQTMTWNESSTELSTNGMSLGTEYILGVKDQLGNVNVSYGLTSPNSCITLDVTTGKVKATCIPNPASVTFTATPSGNENYTNESIELSAEIIKKKVTLTIEQEASDSSYKNDVSIKIGDKLPSIRVSSNDPTIDPSTWGIPIYTYKKTNVEVDNPSIEEGIYTVSASYPSGSLAENYDITWIDATLRVDGITIDENNQSDYFSMISDGKPYTQGTWTNKDIIITPVHDTFNQIDINDAGNKSTNDYTYSVAGDQTVKLSFYNSDGAKVSTTVNLKVDQTAPTLSNFNYENETSLRSFLRAVTFDHFFGEAQQLSFSGSDEAGGSGLNHYRYEIVELDADKNEKPASKKTGTLGLNEKLNLSINTSYRISAWAVDTAGNESDEKIERVYLSNEVAQLNITATSEGKPYDGSTWTKSAVTIKLSSTSGAGIEKYQYSSDGVVFHDITGTPDDEITLPDPLSDVDNVTYTFRAIHNDKTEADKILNLKVDTIKPELNITGTVNGSPYDGSLADQNIELTMHQTNTNISGSTLYYTTSPTSKDTDPKTDSNWKRYTAPITHSANGTFTYYFKAISGAGIGSDPKEYTVKLAKKEYTNITVNVTSEGKLYSPGNWAKGDVTFTLSGGLKDTTQITGYEYTTTNGSKPTASSTWKQVTNKTLKLTNSVKDQTYWFRVTPIDPDGKISAGTKVNLDVDAPSIPVMTCEEINTSRVAQFINLFSFGNWLNKQAEVTMTSNDTMSGIDHYEYIEMIDGVEAESKTSKGTVTYEDEIELSLKARACDKAGNCSAFTSAEEVKIDMKAPSITGVKDQSEYKQYYSPRFVTVTDSLSGLKQATYQKDNTPAGTFTDKEETPIRGQGTYKIYAIDEAGNEVRLAFKIVELPIIETEIDGSDESRDIIDKIIKELDEVKGKIDQNEKDNYEKWIDEAENKWDSLRTKIVEDDKTTSKVEGQGDTTFDPKTELIVEEIPKDKVPVLPRNAIKTYDVRLMKGDKEILPNGDIKVYLPYSEKEAPIVYELNDDGTVNELTTQQESGYVTFVTNSLKKYAISNTAQKENKPNVCVVGPDQKADSSDDVCGEGNGNGVPPVKEEDGSVTVPDGGKVIFPDKEIDAPDGAIINPDGSVDFPDGTHYNPDGNETKKPDPTPNPDDGKNDQVCVAGPDGKLGTADDVCGEGNGTKDPDKKPDGSVTVPDGGKVIFPDKEIDAPDGAIINPDGSVDFPDGTHFDPEGNEVKKPAPKPNPDDGKQPNPDDGKNEQVCVAGPDGKLGTADDVCGEGNGTKDPDKESDGSVTIPDGGSVIFPDGSEIELPDGGTIKPDGSVELPDGTIFNPDGTKKDPDKKKECTLEEKKEINIDTDGDGIPDINLDINGDCKPEINIDVNDDGIPDIDIDTTGDGKADINIDTNKDGKPDLNIVLHLKWKPNVTYTVNGFTYNTMKGLIPDLNVDDDGNGSADRNVDTDGDDLPDVNVDDDWFSKREIKDPNKSTVQGTYTNGTSDTGGASTSDQTKWFVWIIMLSLTTITMIYTIAKKRYQKDTF